MTNDISIPDPAGADGKQTNVVASTHFYDSPFEEDDDMEIRAKDGEGSELYLKMPSTGYMNESEGTDTYRAFTELSDESGHTWIELTDYDSARELTSPGYEEMEELRSKYQEQLDNAETDVEEREVLEEVWDEAAEMDLEGHETFK